MIPGRGQTGRQSEYRFTVKVATATAADASADVNADV